MDNEDFRKILIPMIRKVVPSLIAQQIIGVQPMLMPSSVDPSKIHISYWAYHDGVTREGGTEEYPHIPKKGWSCWAYASHVKEEFEEWMSTCMKGNYECIHRFNSGDPMFTIHIDEDEDAMLFKLRWDNAIK